jgi:hypothetical protein
MKSKLFGLVTFVVLLDLSASHAASVITTNAGLTATEVDGIVVAGTTYDVTFAGDLINPSPFDGDPTGANTAANMLVDALNASTAISVSNTTVTCANCGVFYVEDAAEVSPTPPGGLLIFDNADGTPPPNWENYGNVAGGIPLGWPIAVFNEVGTTTPTTPLPAALPLFATGLGALGLLGWRRKRKA